MWFWYVLIAMFVLKIIVSIGMIGEARRPLTPTDVMWTFVINMLAISGILYFGVLQ